MNILFLNSIEKETYGGMEEWIRLVAAGLAGRGHQVAVAGRPGSRFLERVAAMSGGIELLELDISGDFHPGTISRVRRCLRDRHVDIISVNFNKDVRLGGLAARLNGGTRVVWSVGLDITKDNLIHRWLTPRLIDGVIVPSMSLKQQITSTGYIEREGVEVIPIGIPDTKFVRPDQQAARGLREKYRLPQESVVAVTAGRLVGQKGHVHLIEAAPEIVGAHPEVRFVFLGDGPLEADLRDRAAALNTTEYFVFAGMSHTVDQELAGADLMIHPSVEEPFGIAVLEGMRAGLPIVASRAGGIPEVVGDGDVALLCEAGNTGMLAENVNTVLGDRELKERMGRSGRERFLSEFKVDRMYDRVERYLRGLLSEAEDGKA